VAVVAVNDIFDAFISPRPCRRIGCDVRAALAFVWAEACAERLDEAICRLLISYNRKGKPDPWSLLDLGRDPLVPSARELLRKDRGGVTSARRGPLVSAARTENNEPADRRRIAGDRTRDASDLPLVAPMGHRTIYIPLAQPVIQKPRRCGFPSDGVVVTESDLVQYGEDPGMIISSALREGRPVYGD
jgi:hypothetical protein